MIAEKTKNKGAKKQRIRKQKNIVNNQVEENNDKMNIKSYTQSDIKRFFTNENNFINNVNETINNFVKKYYNPKTKKAKTIINGQTQKLFLGRINDNISDMLDDIINSSNKFNKKYYTKDSNIVISSNNIQHIYNKHGNEKRVGQIDVTPENLAKYGEVVSIPDYIGLSDANSRGGTPTIFFTKRINGHSIAVEVLSTKKQLYPESYYIFETNSKEYKNFIKNHKLKKAWSVVSNELKNSNDINAQSDTPAACANNISKNNDNVKSDISNDSNMQEKESKCIKII